MRRIAIVRDAVRHRHRCNGIRLYLHLVPDHTIAILVGPYLPLRSDHNPIACLSLKVTIHKMRNGEDISPNHRRTHSATPRRHRLLIERTLHSIQHLYLGEIFKRIRSRLSRVDSVTIPCEVFMFLFADTTVLLRVVLPNRNCKMICITTISPTTNVVEIHIHPSCFTPMTLQCSVKKNTLDDNQTGQTMYNDPRIRSGISD